MNSQAFLTQQRAFLNYLRNPADASLPEGFDAGRLKVYADLLYNKFDESLSACFPVIHSLLPKEAWRSLLLEFIAGHTCRTPYYRRIPDEFVQYLRQIRPEDPALPFLADLAHFEWVELQLSIAEAIDLPHRTLTAAQLLRAVPVFAPVTQLLAYQWPVEDIGPDYLPTEVPEDITHILGFRDPNDQVQFVALSTATAHLVRRLHNSGLSGEQALAEMGGNLPQPALSQFMRFGLQTLAELNQRGAIVDWRPLSLS
ncbi:MAG: putative DNA-binding domain-containing protein [Methylomonas sp.]|nr:putative DNA-binding domain-containing protein [Methylomonas sp.]